MRIDKTMSELWNLINTNEDETVKETARRAINALMKSGEQIQKLEEEIERLKKQAYDFDWAKDI